MSLIDKTEDSEFALLQYRVASILPSPTAECLEGFENYWTNNFTAMGGGSWHSLLLSVLILDPNQAILLEPKNSYWECKVWGKSSVTLSEKEVRAGRLK